MPSLNVADYVEEAILSVRNQTLREIEILCVDAGSTDGTTDIIKQHALKDNRVKYIPSRMKSYGYQINYGISLASGKYIGIVETDDYIDKEMYETLFCVAEKDRLDFVKGDYMAFIEDVDGNKFFFKRKTFFRDDLYNIVVKPIEFSEVATRDWYNWQGIYSCRFLRNNSIVFSETPGAAFQDIGFLYQTVIRAERAEYLSNSLYRYRLDRGDSSSNSGRGLKFAYDEFKLLMDERVAVSSDEICFFYLRMAKAFISSFCAMGVEGIRKSGDAHLMYYEWFRDELQGAVDRGLVRENNIEPELWRILGLLLKSQEAFIDDILKYDKDILDAMERGGFNSVIVFGCGNFGYDAYRILKKKGYEISAFMDNDEGLWEKTLDGIPVMSPSSAVDVGSDVLFLIANDLHYEEIRKQLMAYGVDDGRVVVYRK